MALKYSWTYTAPGYRVFVNEELFSERTYIWTDQYLTETLQVEAEPGLEYLNAEQAVYSNNKNVLIGQPKEIKPR